MEPTSTKTSELTVVMYNMSPYRDWEHGVVNRNFHVLQALLRDKRIKKIYAVDFFPFTLKKRVKHLVYNRSRVVDKKLEVISTFFPKKIARLVGEADIIWSYNPLYTGYFSLFPRATYVFDAVDNWAEHPSYKRFRNRILDHYKILASKSHVIFTVADTLREIFGKRDDLYWIPNGVDTDHFQRETALFSYAFPWRRPVVGYVGVIQKRVNFTLVKYLAEKNPNMTFVFAGPVWKDAEVHLVKHIPHIHFLGFVPYKDLPGLIQSFDVAIIPHHVDEFTQSMDPLKMYEYLACGKPMVSTPVAGVSNMGDCVETAVTPEEFSEKIQKVLREDSPELQNKRQEKAREHSWKDRVGLMMNLILQDHPHGS